MRYDLPVWTGRLKVAAVCAATTVVPVLSMTVTLCPGHGLRTVRLPFALRGNG